MPNEIRRIIESSKINGGTNEGINFVFEAPKDSNKVVEIFRKYYEKQ